jgi:hypothetical protein
MGYTQQILDDVRAQLAPEDAALKEAKERREAVRAAAESFHGARRSFASGSLAHATANCPVHQRDKGLDADSGVVLDRRTWSWLGPDSATGEGPTATLEQLCAHLKAKLQPKYPKATFKITKRAILITFNEPLPSGEDPTVDLVMALERFEAPGLWIPNTDIDDWNPSHPERHTELLTADPKALRVVRARAIRLGKAENKRTPTPPICSFNVAAFGLMFVTSGMTEVEALLAMWKGGAADLAHRLTPDPAEVSPPIKVLDREVAVGRLSYAAQRLEAALTRDFDERWVREQLAPLWPEFISTRPGEATRARMVAASRARSGVSITSAGVLSTSTGTLLKQPRSFGEPPQA